MSGRGDLTAVDPQQPVQREEGRWGPDPLDCVRTGTHPPHHRTPVVVDEDYDPHESLFSVLMFLVVFGEIGYAHKSNSIAVTSEL